MISSGARVIYSSRLGPCGDKRENEKQEIAQVHWESHMIAIPSVESTKFIRSVDSSSQASKSNTLVKVSGFLRGKRCTCEFCDLIRIDTLLRCSFARTTSSATVRLLPWIVHVYFHLGVKAGRQDALKSDKSSCLLDRINAYAFSQMS